jgi:hypothetical protein
MLGKLFSPRISGDNSIVTSLATVAVVVAIYQAKVGPVSDVHATAPNDGNIAASIKKAGWQSLGVVAAISLLAGDMNIIILGGAAVVAEELSYRHANMTHPATGQIAVTPQAYAPAGIPDYAAA